MLHSHKWDTYQINDTHVKVDKLWFEKIRSVSHKGKKIRLESLQHGNVNITYVTHSSAIKV